MLSNSLHRENLVMILYGDEKPQDKDDPVGISMDVKNVITFFKRFSDVRILKAHIDSLSLSEFEADIKKRRQEGHKKNLCLLYRTCQ